jgi:hypothetical protein
MKLNSVFREAKLKEFLCADIRISTCICAFDIQKKTNFSENQTFITNRTLRHKFTQYLQKQVFLLDTKSRIFHNIVQQFKAVESEPT